MNIKRIIVLAFIAITPLLATAQQENEVSNSKRSLLDELVVTGTATRNSLRNTPVKTHLYTKKYIESVQATDFIDLMSRISPSFSFSPSNMGSRMQLNGLGNDYILILIDGERLYGDVGGQSELSRININNIDKIEIVNGASSSLYGTDAIAGVINIITKKSKDKILITNNTRVGSYGEFQQGNSINLNLGNLYSSSSFNSKHSDGWQLSPYTEVKDRKNKGKMKLVPTTAKSVNEYSDLDLKQNLSYRINTKLSVKAQGSYYQKDTKQDIDYKSYGYYHEGKSLSLGAHYKMDKDSHLMLDLIVNDYQYFNKYNSKYNEQYITREGKEKQITYYAGDKFKNSDQKRYTIKAKAVTKVLGINKINAGIEYYKDFLESEYRLKEQSVSAYSLAVYIQDEIKIQDKIYLVGGLRYSHNERFSNELTPKLAVLYKISDINLRASYGAGYKAPSLKELYLQYETSKMGKHSLYLGNESLKAQGSNYYSISTEYNKETFSISATAYYNKVKDLISYRTIASTEASKARGIVQTRENYNISDALSKGIDLSFSAYIGQGLDINGGYSYVDSEDLATNNPLQATSKQYANLSTSWTKDWKHYTVQLSLVGRYQSSRYFDDGNVGSYNIWKINSKHKIRSFESISLETNLGIDNIFDFTDKSPYSSNHSTLSPGRTYYCSLNIRFTK